MPQRFEISFRIPRSGPAGQSALPRPTSRLKAFLQTCAALFVVGAILTVGIAIGTAVAIFATAFVAIALGTFFVRGVLYRTRFSDKRIGG
jgi:hypothetical protein